MATNNNRGKDITESPTTWTYIYMRGKSLYIPDHAFVKAGQNTSTVVPVSRKRQKKGNAVPRGIAGPVSNGTVKYGYGS
jgi:hypothetical protein